MQSLSEQIINKKMSNPPPWAKNNNTTSQPPPWSKNNATDTTANNVASNPPWANKNIANSNSVQPPWGQKTPFNNSQPIATNSQPPSTNTPPWVKNAVNTPVQSANTNQPPWAKTSVTAPLSNLPVKQTPLKQPPWSKTNTTNPIPDLSVKQPQAKQPPWAKQNTNQTNQAPVVEPPWAKKNNTQNSEKQPPWTKKESNSPMNSQSNLYKIQQTAQIQKQKKELQQTIKRQQQEQREQKRLQRQRRQKEEEEANIKKELQQMAKEDAQSIARQAFEKEQARIQRQQVQRKQDQQRLKIQKQKQKQEQGRLLRQAEERKRNQEEERQVERLKLLKEKQQHQTLDRQKQLKLNDSQVKSKSKAKSSRKVKKQYESQQNSKISHISSIKALQIQIPTDRSKQIPQNQNLFHKYNRLINDEHNQSNYKNKIQIQKQIIDLQLTFKKQCELQIMNIVEKKKITNRRRKFIMSNNLQIKYGLCQGKKKDNKINFVSSECDDLKLRFICYEMLNKCINSLLKKKMNINLRIPLLNLCEYKGIIFLIEHICEELVDIIEIDINLYQEINNQILILQKQLQIYYDGFKHMIKPITKNEMLVKKINIYNQDYYLIYLKDHIYQDSSHQSAHYHQQHQYHFNQIEFLETITNPSHILPYYQHPIQINQQTLEQYDQMGSQFKTIAQSIYLATAINTVYSSCQGEVNEPSFFQLVLDENKQVWEMIGMAGYKQKDLPMMLALSYLEKIGSIKFNMTTQSIALQQGKKRQLIKCVKPKVCMQKQDFQFLQFIKNTQKYINQGRSQLIELSIAMNRDFWSKIKEESQINLLQIKNEINYLIYKKEYQKAVEYLDLSQRKLSSLDIRHISIDLLHLRIYIILDEEIKIINTLTHLINLLELYFKTQTIIHSYVYTIVGTYYSKKGNQANQDKEKHVIIFYEHALNIALKLYGQKAYEIAEIYLNRANAFFNLKINDLFHKDIAQALKLFKMHSKSGSRIAQCHFLLGKVQCSQGNLKQGIQNMELSVETFLKLQNYIQSLNIYFSMLQYLHENESEYEVKLQEMIEICFMYKCVWAFTKIITVVLERQLNCYSSLTIGNIESILNQENDMESRTNQEILIELENSIKGFTSFIQILRWSLSILAAKMIVRRQTSTDYEKAYNIMKGVFHFYVKENIVPSFDLKESFLI